MLGLNCFGEFCWAARQEFNKPNVNEVKKSVYERLGEDLAELAEEWKIDSAVFGMVLVVMICKVMMSLMVWFAVLVCRRCRNGRPTKANSPTNQDKTHKLHSGNADTVPMCGVQWWTGSRNGIENQGEKAVKNKMYLNPFEQERAEINLDDCKLGLIKHCSGTEKETLSLKDFTECKQENNEDIREYAARIIKIGKEILSSCPDENINEIMKNQFALGLNDLTARKIVLEKNPKIPTN